MNPLELTSNLPGDELAIELDAPRQGILKMPATPPAGSSRIEGSMASSSQTYPYAKLPEGHIRLLRLAPGPKGSEIEIQLTSIPLEEATDGYLALSYTWGDTQETKNISCMGGSFITVTQNLYDALHAWRHDTEVAYFWADQITINQQDKEERRQQVKLMGKIYSGAQFVVVWLSNQVWETPNLVDNLTPFYQLCETQPEYIAHCSGNFCDRLATLSSDTWTAISTILSCPYFRRVWIIQEIIKAKHARFLCGGHAIGMEVLLTISRVLQWADIPAGVLPGEMRGNTRALMKIDTMMGRLHSTSDEPWPTAKWTLLDLLFKSWDFLATDPRDKLYALAALLEYTEQCVPQVVDPDYTRNFEDIMRETIISGFCEQSCFRSLDYCEPSFSDQNPSWMPDPTQPVVRPVDLGMKRHLYSAGKPPCGVVKRVPGDDSALLFEVRLIGKIKELSPYEPIKANGKTEYDRHDFQSYSVDVYLQEIVERIAAYESLGFGDREETSTEEDELFIRVISCDLSINGFDALDTSEISEIKSMLTEKWDEDRVQEQAERLHMAVRTGFEMRFCCYDGRVQAASGAELPMIGWVPDGVVSGDSVCVVHGYEIPMVVRRHPDGGYRFLGMAFVGGMMHGQAFTGDKYPPEYIMVR